MEPLVPLQEFALDPARVQFNHGGFGAPPRAVLDAAAAVRARVEADPTAFLTGPWLDGQREARRQVAALLHADPADLLPVANTTTGTATVLASLTWQPGDELVVTDHGYPAVAAQAAELARRRDVRVVPVPALPVDGLPGRLAQAVTGRTRVVLVDAITSASALVLPVQAVRAALPQGPLLVVDAAHAPVHLDVDVPALGVDVWTGNLHKWGATPRPCAVLWRAPRHRGLLAPLVPSSAGAMWPHDDGAAFGWPGTHDPSPWLAVPTALDWLAGLGGATVLRGHAGAVLDLAGQVLEELLGGAPDAAAAPMMRAWPLPPGTDRQVLLAALDAAGITANATVVPGQQALRLCAYAYSGSSDVDRLAEALPAALRAARR